MSEPERVANKKKKKGGGYLVHPMPIHVVVVVVVLPSARGGADVVMVVVVESEWRGTLSFEVQHPCVMCRSHVDVELQTTKFNNSLPPPNNLHHHQWHGTDTAPRHNARHEKHAHMGAFFVFDTPHLSFEHENHPPWVHFRVWCLLNTTGTEKPPMLGRFSCLMPFPSRWAWKRAHLGAFSFRTCQARKHTDLGRVFLFGTLSLSKNFNTCFSYNNKWKSDIKSRKFPY